jgi:predicted Zn-dependent peptidase
MNKQLIKNEWLGETVHHAILPSGLKIFVLPKPGYTKQYATFASHYGSIDNKFILPGTEQQIEVPDGIAHFLEHKLFEEEFGNIFDEFAKLGANTNAFTSWNITSYLFSSTENFHENLSLLLDFVQRPYFTEENVEKEKGIIEQEIRMYQDSPHWCALVNLLGALFHSHPVKIDIAGTVESIRKITPETLLKCYNTFYHPSNMAIFATGDLEPDRVIDQIAENLARHEYASQAPIQRVYPPEPKTVFKQQVEQALAVSRPSQYLGFKDTRVGFGGKELLEKEIASEILLEGIFGRGSELFNSLYEAGLIDENFTREYLGEVTYGASILGGETKDPEQLQQRIVDGISKLRRDGLDPQVLERSRKKLLGRFARGFNSLEFVANNFLNYQFMGTEIFEYPLLLREMPLETIQARFAEHFSLDNLAQSRIVPKA